MSPDVSVVVPVYNSMPYLERCLESLLAQTDRSFEVICVDDCSTDGSAELVGRLAADHPELTLVSHEANRGVSASRNTGLARARGRYVLFVDGDDFVDDCLLDRAAGKADALGAQALVFGFNEYYGKIDTYVPVGLFDDPALAGRAFSLDELKETSTELTTPNVWRILYRRDFLAGLGARFHEDLRTAEDLAFIYETLPYAERVAFLAEPLYHYRRDGGSTLTRAGRGVSGLTALGYVRRRMEEAGASAAMERHFVNLVLDTADYALRSAASRTEFDGLFGLLRSEWLPYVRAREGLVAPRYLPFYRSASQNDPEGQLYAYYAASWAASEALRAEVSRRDAALHDASLREEGLRAELEAARGREEGLRAELEAARGREDALRAELEAVRASWAFRVGRAATYVPSKAKAAVLGLRK